MPRTSNPIALKNRYADIRCSLAHSLNVMGDRWSPLILRDLSYGPQRFDDLAEDLGVARNLLTSRLNRLVDAGVVSRTPYQQRPPRYDYDLTEAGRELAPVLMALASWGDRWATPEGGPPIAYEHLTCGNIFTPKLSCSVCGQEVSLRDVEFQKGPGPLLGRGTLLASAFIARRREARQGRTDRTS